MDLTQKLSDGYKSEGERKIAALLDRRKIPFLYEKETLVEDNFKLKIWYPDFYLPNFKVYVEYFGVTGDPAYQAMTEHKLRVFRENNFDLVPVYPEHLAQLEPYLFGGIERILKGRVNEFGKLAGARYPALEVQACYRALRQPSTSNGHLNGRNGSRG